MKAEEVKSKASPNNRCTKPLYSGTVADTDDIVITPYDRQLQSDLAEKGIFVEIRKIKVSDNI